MKKHYYFPLSSLLLLAAVAFAQNTAKPEDVKPPKNVHLLTGEQHAEILFDLASEKEVMTRKQAEAEKEKEPYVLERQQIFTEACKQAYKDAGVSEVGECQADLSVKDPKTGKVVGGVWPKPKEEPKVKEDAKAKEEPKAFPATGLAK